MRTWLGTGRSKWVAAALLLALLVATAGSMALTFWRDDAPDRATAGPPSPTAAPASTATVTPAPTPVHRRFGLLDGVGLSEAEWEKRNDLLPLAVMFDNSEQAFPHDGLHKADLIYEAFVEGGITRLMAVYWRQDAEFLEPLRSARTPFVVWADELDALYAHAGGATTSNEANSTGQIIEWGIKDLEAFGEIADKFYRDPDRQVPHDLATSTAKLRAGAAILGYAGPPKLASWLFRDDVTPSAAGDPARGIEIDFGGTQRLRWQTVQYRWDEAAKSYARYQYGGPHLDARSKEPLRFTTVIAMRALYQVVDGAGHVLIDQIGAGPATVFTDGRAIQATWKKADRKARTRFYDAAGAEIKFARGPIFVEVLGAGSALTVKADAAGLLSLPEYTPPPPEPEATPKPSPTPSATAKPGGTPTGQPSNAPSPGASITPGVTTTPIPPTPAGSPTVGQSPTPRTETPATTSTP